MILRVLLVKVGTRLQLQERVSLCRFQEEGLPTRDLLNLPSRLSMLMRPPSNMRFRLLINLLLSKMLARRIGPQLQIYSSKPSRGGLSSLFCMLNFLRIRAPFSSSPIILKPSVPLSCQWPTREESSQEHLCSKLQCRQAFPCPRVLSTMCSPRCFCQATYQ